MLYSSTVRTFALALAFAASTATTAAFAVPMGLPFSARLTTDAGTGYMGDGTLDLELSLHAGPQTADSLWGPYSLTNVESYDGFFSVVLGEADTGPISEATLSSPALYLQVSVDGTLLLPRLRVLSVPYARRAGSAEAVGDIDASQVVSFGDLGSAAISNSYLDLDDAPQGPEANLVAFGANPGELQATPVFHAAGAVGVGTSAPQATLDVAGGVRLGYVAVCNAANEGTMRYNQAIQLVEVCTASGWKGFGAAPPCVGATLASQPGNQSAASGGNANFSVTLASGVASSYQWQVSVGGASFVDLSNGAGVAGATTNVLLLSAIPPAWNGNAYRVVVTDTCGGSVTSNSATLTASFTGKRVFVTSTLHTGNFGGVTGADLKCQQRASAAGLPGTYKAWLSGSTLASSPSVRFTKSTTLPYVLVDGTVIANNWADLTDGTLQHAINVTELNTPASTNLVYSFTRIDGTPGLFGSSSTNCYGGDCHCNNWNSVATQGSPTPGSASGQTSKSNDDWTDYSFGNFCGGNYPIYCFEQ